MRNESVACLSDGEGDKPPYPSLHPNAVAVMPHAASRHGELPVATGSRRFPPRRRRDMDNLPQPRVR